MSSKITDELIASYHSASYCFGTGPSAILLCIDQYSKPLSSLIAESGRRCAVFISAYNPGSRIQSSESNRVAHDRLHNDLRPHADQIIEGVSSDPSGVWPPEMGFLAVGVDLATAQRLGDQYGQNAILWADEDAIPRLILLR
jgi:hypothetical protein